MSPPHSTARPSSTLEPAADAAWPTPAGIAPFAPFRSATVRPIHPTTAAQRRQILESCGWNLFRVPSDMVAIDLLTDSGTGAMSAAQWSALMRGDESYAGSSSYFRLVAALERITGFTHVLPTHQGRVAERLLVETLIGGPEAGAGKTIPNNAHFDTTRHMIESSGAEAINLLARGGDAPDHPALFKGDMDLAALERLLEEHGDEVPWVMLTVTCNSNGGQPVSLANMRGVRDICRRFGKMLVLDACRFAENAWFIHQREHGQDGRTVASIVRETFDLCDAVAMSTRKDGLCNVGGLLLFRDPALYRRACRLCVLTHGFQMTYGSLPGRDLEAIAVGLDEVMDETYLSQRAAMIGDLGATLQRGGVRIVQPVGGHAVFIDAEDFCPHLAQQLHAGSIDGCDVPPSGVIGQSLACALYEQAGIRAAAVGSALIDRTSPRPSGEMDLLRLAIPRRTYSESHLVHAAEMIVALKARGPAITLRPLPHDLDAEPRQSRPAVFAR